MKVYWDVEDHSYIIENENGKRMRISSGKVETNPASDHVVMTDAILVHVHKVDPLDMVNVGDEVYPAEIARDGVILRLIGTDCFVIYCENHWRFLNGERVEFPVHEAVLYSKRDETLLSQVKTRVRES